MLPRLAMLQDHLAGTSVVASPNPRQQQAQVVHTTGGSLLGTHPTWMELSRAALHHNVRHCSDQAGGIDLIASVKANAYGHGVVEVSKLLSEVGVHTLWTGSFQDALALRRAGLQDARILMFAGALPSAMGELLAADVVPTVVNLEAAQAVSAAAITRGTRASVCVKIDCGFGRLGARVDKGGLELLQAVHAMPSVRLDCVYTHLPFVDQAGLDWAMAGTAAFAQLMKELAALGIPPPEIIQAGASGEVLTRTVQPVDTAVCVGHALYGIDPFTTLGLGGEQPLRSSSTQVVLASIKSRLIHVMRHDGVAAGFAHTGLSYVGAAAQATPDAPITLGVIPFGLGDGARIAAEGQTAFVVIRGLSLPVVATSLVRTAHATLVGSLTDCCTLSWAGVHYDRSHVMPRCSTG
jgi:alanine racemase